MFGTLQLIFSLTLPISAYLSRIFKNLMISMPGEAVGFGPIFTLLFSFFFLLRSPTGPFLPVGVSSGSRFRGHLDNNEGDVNEGDVVENFHLTI